MRRTLYYCQHICFHCMFLSFAEKRYYMEPAAGTPEFIDKLLGVEFLEYVHLPRCYHYTQTHPDYFLALIRLSTTGTGRT